MSSCPSSTVNQIPGSYPSIDVQDQSDYEYAPMSYTEDEIANFDLDSPEYRALLVPPNYDHTWSPSWSLMPSGDSEQFQPRQQQPPLSHPLPSFPGIHHQECVVVPNVDHTEFNPPGEYELIHPHLPSTGPVSRMRAKPITVPNTPHCPGLQTGEPRQPYHNTFNQNHVAGYKRSSEKPLVELQYHRDQISGRSPSASGPLDFSQVNAPQPQEVATRDEERRSVPAFQMPEWQLFIPSPTESHPESATSSSTTPTSTSASHGSGSGSEAYSSPLTSPDPPSPPIGSPSPASPSSSSSLQSLKRKLAGNESRPSSSKPVKKAKQTAEKPGTAAKPGKKQAVYEHHPYNPSAPRSLQTWNMCTGQKEEQECWGERMRDDSNYFIHISPFTQRFRLSPSATLGTPSPSSVAEAPERPDLFRFSATSSVTLNLFGGYYLKANPTHKPTKQDLQALFDGLSETEKKVWAERRQEKLAGRKAPTA